MRYFMKFYPDCTIGTVEQVDDSMTLLSGNDEKGVFNWIEVFDKQQLATARREGWEQAKAGAILEAKKIVDALRPTSPDIRFAEFVQYAIAAMEYGESK